MSEKTPFWKMFEPRGTKVGETLGEKLVPQLEAKGKIDPLDAPEMAKKIDAIDRLTGKIKKEDFDEGVIEFKLEYQNASPEERSAWLLVVYEAEERNRAKDSFMTKTILPDLPQRLASLREWVTANK